MPDASGRDALFFCKSFRSFFSPFICCGRDEIRPQKLRLSFGDRQGNCIKNHCDIRLLYTFITESSMRRMHKKLLCAGEVYIVKTDGRIV